MEVHRAGELLDVVGLKGKGVKGLARGLFRLPKAMLQARRILQQEKPDIVIGVGGYASGPVVLMAALSGPGRPVWMQPLGTSLVWQGMMGGLVAGIGGMLLPMLLHREPHKGDRTVRSWSAIGPGLVCALVVPALVSGADTAMWRPVVVVVLAAVATVAGAAGRWQAPFVLGGGSLVLVTVLQLGPWAGHLLVQTQGWVLLALCGTVLLALALRYRTAAERAFYKALSELQRLRTTIREDARRAERDEQKAIEREIDQWINTPFTSLPRQFVSQTPSAAAPGSPADLSSRSVPLPHSTASVS